MSVRFLTLASGSKGNCSFIGTPHAQVLVDCGIGPRRLAQTLASHGIDWHRLDAVFITHLHTDHVGGLPALLKHVPQLRVYCHQRAAEELSAMLRGEAVNPEWARLMRKQPTLFASPPPEYVDLATFNGNHGFYHRDLDVLALRVSHDCEPTVAFKVFAAGRQLGVLTDLGTYDEQLAAAFGDCEALLLESNHCLKMLAEGPYPEYLKQRIRGHAGHLSNEQSLNFTCGLARMPRYLLLGHLSDNNNHPDVVRETFAEMGAITPAQPAPPAPVTILTQLTPGPLLEL